MIGKMDNNNNIVAEEIKKIQYTNIRLVFLVFDLIVHGV